MFQSAGFLTCSKDVLAHILEVNILSCTEVDVFHACMHWVKAKNGDDNDTLSKESVENHLGNLFYMIRFASMAMEQLQTLQEQCESVLTPHFIVISKIITSKNSLQVDNFDTSPRRAIWNADAIIKCSFKNGNGNEIVCVIPPIIHATFTMSGPLLLGGFTCGKVINVKNGVPHDLPERGIPVYVGISKSLALLDPNAEILSNMTAYFHSTETHTALEEPILVRPGFHYGILIEPFKNNHRYCSEELKAEIRLQSDILVGYHELEIEPTSQKTSWIDLCIGFQRNLSVRQSIEH